MLTLLPSLLIVYGKATYANLSRYSELCERTYRRHYSQGIGFEAVHQQLIEQQGSSGGVQIGVVDCTFGEKSGRHTPGLDWFYNGKTQQTEKGLEWSVIGVVDLDQSIFETSPLPFLSLRSYAEPSMNISLNTLFLTSTLTRVQLNPIQTGQTFSSTAPSLLKTVRSVARSTARDKTLFWR